MDNYRECLVARERSQQDRLAELIFMGLAIAFCIVAVLVNSLAFIPAAICVLFWYLRMKHYNVEHEYILTADQLTVDQIINQKSRKRKGEYELKQVQAAADTQDQRLEKLRTRKPRIEDYTSRGERARDLSLFLMDEKQQLVEVRLTPDETMKKMIMKQVPSMARRLDMI